HNEKLYDLASVVNVHCNKYCFDTLTEEQFISGLKTKPWLPLRTPLSKQMEKNLNMTLQVMVREGVKIVNLMRDSALVDSDALPTRLCRKSLHLCFNQHNLWHKNRPYLVYAA
ncbi:unnamed protein product, partial [Hymenolepis diminuta]